jgi:hypothetical protein
VATTCLAVYYGSWFIPSVSEWGRRTIPHRSINLVSTYASQTHVTGPKKVLDNLVKGLARIDEPFVVNRALDSTSRIWVHSDLRALLELPPDSTVNVLGPNLVVLPRDMPTRRPFPRSVYLQPSKWAADVWVEEEFTQCPLRVWAAGIDTNEFPVRREPPIGAPILVYFKRRSPSDLARVKEFLSDTGLVYQVLVYGEYTQEDYIRLLKDCSFVVWLGRQESQGIALQEALAMNVPILVIDATSFFNEYPAPTSMFPARLRSFRTTSTPYFDQRCGVVLDSVEQLRQGLEMMAERRESFRPREYILQNLSLEGQARKFVGFFEDLESRHEPNHNLENRWTRRWLSLQKEYTPRLATRVKLKLAILTSRFLRANRA